MDRGTVEPELEAKRVEADERRRRDELVAEYTSLALSLARRYARSSEAPEDLGQVALLGLVRAAARFDPQRGVTFATFAIPTVLGELRRYFRDCGWALRVPRRDQERALAVRDAEQALAREHGRAPTVQMIAEFLELSVEEVLDGLLAMNAYSASSLQAPAADESYESTVGRADENYERVERLMLLSCGLPALSPRDRAILRMRFTEELSQSQIAARLGISQMQVSRLLQRIFRDMRDAIEQGPPARRSGSGTARRGPSGSPSTARAGRTRRPRPARHQQARRRSSAASDVDGASRPG